MNTYLPNINHFMNSLKPLFEEYPELLDYLEDEDYKTFSYEIEKIINDGDLPLDDELDYQDTLGVLTAALDKVGFLEELIDDLKYIPDWCEFIAFTSYEIPEGVSLLQTHTFVDANLESITIPNTVETFRKAVFNRCGSLKDIYYKGTVIEFLEAMFLPGESQLIDDTLAVLTHSSVTKKYANSVFNNPGIHIQEIVRTKLGLMTKVNFHFKED